MWTRSALKQRGKVAFKRSYWKTVLVTLIFALTVGGASQTGGIGNLSGLMAADSAASVSTEQAEPMPGPNGDINYNYERSRAAEEDLMADEPVESDIDEEDAAILAFIAFVVLVIFVLAAAALILMGLPIQVGCQRFFFQNLREPGRVQDVLWAFDNHYRNIVKVMFLRDIKIMLWSLLLVVPGIIKTYEYRMIPYILAETPDMPSKQVFIRTKQLMTGNKWRAFVLDLSFLGWQVLGACTLGLLSIFYVAPYRNSTFAALYEALSKGTPEEPELAGLPAPSAPVPPAQPSGWAAPADAPADAPAVPRDPDLPLDPRL